MCSHCTWANSSYEFGNKKIDEILDEIVNYGTVMCEVKVTDQNEHSVKYDFDFIKLLNENKEQKTMIETINARLLKLEIIFNHLRNINPVIDQCVNIAEEVVNDKE